MNLKEIQGQLKNQIDDIDRQIAELNSKKRLAISSGQDVIRNLWDKESPKKQGARCVIGPKMYEVGIRFDKYRPYVAEVSVFELTKAKTLKETYGSYQGLEDFLKKYPEVPFFNPLDSGYNKLGPLNPKNLKSYQGFRVGQPVTWSVFSGWRSSNYDGNIKNFTPTGKVTVVSGPNGRVKTTLDISKIKPVD